MQTRMDRKLEAVTNSIDKLAQPFNEPARRLGYPKEFITTICSVTALVMLGEKVRLAAGSARWLVMSIEEQGEAMLDTRKPIGYFGYDFDMESSLSDLVAMDFPPDLHTWAVSEGGVIYDFTTAAQMLIFKEQAEVEWPTARRLPAAICGTAEDLAAEGWIYEENEQATQFAMTMVSRLILTTVARARGVIL